jgi:methyl-accepting chemotaxis protein
MKINLPVSHREVLMEEGAVIVTRTDQKGIITFANPEFVKISGFAEAELIGNNHNIVRHPDMPPEAFADMWATLKQGKPWSGIVKNRCKDGDHYWVQAHVSPMEEQGKVVGYISMRTKPTAEEVKAAATLYQAVKAGKFRLSEGAALPAGLWSRIDPFRFMSNLSVNAQITVWLGVLMLIFLLFANMAYRTVEQVRVNGPIYQNVMQGKDLIAAIEPSSEHLAESYLVALQMLNASASELPALVEDARRMRREYEERRRYWVTALPEGELRNLLTNDAYEAGRQFLELRDGRYIPALQAGERRTAEAVLADMQRKYSAHRAVIGQVVTLAKQRNSGDEKESDALIISKELQMVALAAFGAVVAVVLGWLFARNMRQVLGGDPRYARQIARHVAAGNLAVSVRTAPDDVTSLLAAIRQMQEKFRKTIRETQEGANRVAQVAQQMSATSEQVSTSASQSSTSAATMASATEQMTASMGVVVENAKEAHGISGQSEKVCLDGVAVIQQAVRSMADIAATVRESTSVVMLLGEQSEQITSVMRVIRDIADQTNLLALNAAIEAARAGEQGRGFAVVADEVRKLAERTTSATEEIAKMVGTIQDGMHKVVKTMERGVQQVDEGVHEANKAGEAIHDIREGAQRVLEVVASIAGALDEQGKASEQIALHVEEIARMSEENSAVAHAASTGANQLLEASLRMRSAANCFAV